MKLAPIFTFAFSRARYLALALPLFALVSTVEGGCSGNSPYGGYYYGSSGGKRSGGLVPDCPTYAVYTGYGYGGYTSYNNCDDNGGYGP